MNRFLYLLMAIAAGALTVCAQSAADHKLPVVDGSVESVGGRLRVSLTNTDSAREFRGAAQVSIDTPDRQSEVARFEFTLAPQESRLFPIDSQGAAGDHYTLSIHERTGTLILLKNAPINRSADASWAIVTPQAPKPPAPKPPASTAQPAAKGLTVKARLAAGRPRPSSRAETKTPAEQPSEPQEKETNLVVVPAAPTAAPDVTAPEQQSGQQADVIKKQSARVARRGKSAEATSPAVERQTSPPAGEVEAPISDDPTSMVLAFDITAPSPIINASLSVSAKGFKGRQTVTVHGTGSAEFELPDEFNEPKINYTLTDASGKTLIAGEFDFEALRSEDSVRVSEVKFDRESYGPGQSAHIVMTLEGRAPNGYLLEVTAKDENGSFLLNDSRKGIFSKGKSFQEFQIEIPAEAHGGIAVEFKASGNLTKKLFDSGTRDLIINDTQNEKTESRGLKIEGRRPKIEDPR
ncbi:MAG TPA: hypothetical protein VKS99_15090 [Blastocatellia bacterium]|nr:hypothetical protein [Blastocatellia bacterium]